MTALDKSISPYLLQHKDNPVAWRPWSNAVLAEAKAAGKPIFLHIGYTGCHWCQDEPGKPSDAQTALINDNYIPVLVDREERPDIDQIHRVAAAIVGSGLAAQCLHDAGRRTVYAGFLGRDALPDVRLSGRAFADLLKAWVAFSFQEQPGEVTAAPTRKS